jgi:dGTPase
MFRQVIVRKLLDLQIESLLRHCERFLRTSHWTSPDDARSSAFVIDMEPEVAADRRELAQFLYDRIYRHERLLAVRRQAQREIHALFAHFVENPEQLPLPFQKRAEDVGWPRSAGEYIAGMTDRYCRDQYARVAREASA